MISIITPWLEHPELIPAYEQAVAGAEVVIIDQASSAAVAAELDAMVGRLGNGSRVFHNTENRFFATANNQGLELVSHDIILALNNDIEAEPGWVQYVERDTPDDALVGPVVAMFPVGDDEYPYIEGWCLSACRHVWSTVGGWDAENYYHAYVEDVDLCWRARITGFRLLQSRWPVRHLSNATNRDLPGAYDHADGNRAKFAERAQAWLAGRLEI